MLDRSKQGYNAHSPSVRQVRHRFVRHRVTTLAGPMQPGPDTGLQHSLAPCNMGQTQGYNTLWSYATWVRQRVITLAAPMPLGPDTGLQHPLATCYMGKTQTTTNTGVRPGYTTHWPNTTLAKHRKQYTPAPCHMGHTHYTKLTGIPHGPGTRIQPSLECHMGQTQDTTLTGPVPHCPDTRYNT